MFKDNIRPYEISLWTLQDDFISILKPVNFSSLGQIEEPKVVLKNDGTQELSFKIPMYFYKENRLIENPYWCDVKNGVLLINLRKLKVIFNKGENEEEVFEFVINKITETHSEGKLYCEVFSEGLAFQELGKIGYRFSLSEEVFLNDHSAWVEKTVGEGEDYDYASEEAKAAAEPINNINYWCNKIFENSNWKYSIQMDWSSFDGIIDIIDNDTREKDGFRRTDKIYEEEYVSSWILNETNNSLECQEIEPFKEKCRIITAEKSNLYNITQTIAETFGVFCKYKYYYDDNYHIIDRECIFYNNFLSEKEGSIDINYPYDASKIEREIDSTDITTKLYITPIESDSSPNGLITIADASANKIKEDYILNFDYLYSIGTISEEQYVEITTYERSMYNINSELIPLSAKINSLKNNLVKAEAQESVTNASIKAAQEQMEEALSSIDSLVDGKKTFQKTEDNPYRGMLLEESGEKEKYYVKISLEGVLSPDKQDDNGKNYPFKIFYYKKTDQGTEGKTLTKYSGPYEIVKDDNGNIVKVKNLELKNNSYSKFYYFVFDYKPSLYYENIYSTYSRILIKNEAEREKLENKIKLINKQIETLEKEYAELLEKKATLISDFENMMGPALKEGSWQAEDYRDIGDKFEEKLIFGSSPSNSKYLSFLWDIVPFDGEQLNYEEESIEKEKEYYPTLKITPEILEKIKNNLNDLSLYYTDSIGNIHYFTIGAELQFGFLRENKLPISEIFPILMLTKSFTQSELKEIIPNSYLGIVSNSVLRNGSLNIEVKNLVQNNDIIWIGKNSTGSEENIEHNFNNLAEYDFLYPRLIINSLLLKESEDEFFIKYQNNTLKNYEDYSILIRENQYFITLKNDFIFSEGKIEKEIDILYTLSNASLSLYLDALEVSKTNAMPQVSYTAEISALNKTFIKQAYKMLNRIVNINDRELKFENVQGYISELELDLEQYWQDSITVQNYKTKFEDLFSTIVASSEQMKVNSFSYNNAASAFGPGGTLKNQVVQKAISQTDLVYAFNNGNLTIDELKGIWATSDNGVVAMRGGGIFAATEKDTNGNWIWNTGITPEGINASLIRAGQIDTNLIRIYSGDNIRFQMNSEGLFAYATDNYGEPNFSRYVKYNNEGLSLIQEGVVVKDSTVNLKLVELGFNGLIIRNVSGTPVFSADEYGNLSIIGHFEAASGKIGGWTITDKGIEYIKEEEEEDGSSKQKKLAGIIIEEKPSEIPYDMFYVTGENNGPSFKVKSDGTLFANNGIFSGIVVAEGIEILETSSMINTLKQLEIINFDGTSFNYSNPNFDGKYVLERDWLRFCAKKNAIGTVERWKIEIIEGENEQETLKLIYDSTKMNSTEYLKIESLNPLTFVLKSGILMLDDSFMEPDILRLRITAFTTGKIINNKNIEEEKELFYPCDLIITNEKKDLNKRISQFDPPSYSFISPTEYEEEMERQRVEAIENFNDKGATLEEKFGEKYFLGDSFRDISSFENFKTFLISLELEESILEKIIDLNSIIEYADEIIESLKESCWKFWSKEFSLILENIPLVLTDATINDKVESAEITIFNGNAIMSEEETSSVTDEDSSIFLVPDEELNNGKLEINGVIIAEGNNIIEGNASGFQVRYEKIDENKIKVIFTIRYDRVPEGGEILLRYVFETAERTCHVFRPRDGKSNINVVIESSEGNIFKNGNLSTTFNVKVYEGRVLLNTKGSSYGYLWFKNDTLIEDIGFSSSEYTIESESIDKKAIYSVQVYLTVEEAKEAANKLNNSN